MVTHIIFLGLVLLMAMPASARNVFSRTLVYRPYRKKAADISIEFLNTMKSLGYNGWMFDSQLSIRPADPKIATDAAKADLARTVAHAKKLGIALIPMSQQQNGLCYTDMNFGEASLTKGSKFKVSGPTANFVGDPVSLTNPGFESQATGWSKNTYFKIDNTVKHSGSASMCVTDPKGSAMIRQPITIKPFTTYEVSVWIKTSNFTETRNVGLAVKGGSGWLHHTRESRGAIKTRNWRVHKISFNSMKYTSASITVVATEGKTSTGKVWYDDVAVREVGLYETVIRSTTKPVVKSTTGVVYQAGKDYTVDVDPTVKKHNQGRLLIPAGSSIPNGATVLVDWYKLANTITALPPATTGHPEAWVLHDQHIKLVDQMFQNPVGRMMKYSEWRGLAGWDPGVQSQFSSTGTYWAWIIQKTENLYRQADPHREVYIWNDEVDPYHNGEKNNPAHWNGNHGAWKGLSEETVILNWNASSIPNAKMKSLLWFAGIDPEHPEKKNMQRQIISPGAFAPNDGNGGWKAWLPILDQAEKNTANPLPDGAVIGIIYHTYRDNYTELDVMKNACVQAGRWAPEFPFVPRQVGMVPRKTVAVTGALSLDVRSSGGAGKNVQYTVQNDGRVTLNVVNAMGKTVKTLVHHEKRSAGKHNVSLDASKMPAGVYFVNLEVDNGAAKMAKKVVLF